MSAKLTREFLPSAVLLAAGLLLTGDLAFAQDADRDAIEERHCADILAAAADAEAANGKSDEESMAAKEFGLAVMIWTHGYLQGRPGDHFDKERPLDRDGLRATAREVIAACEKQPDANYLEVLRSLP